MYLIVLSNSSTTSVQNTYSYNSFISSYDDPSTTRVRAVSASVGGEERAERVIWPSLDSFYEDQSGTNSPVFLGPAANRGYEGDLLRDGETRTGSL